MILQEFPNIEWLRKQANSNFKDQRGINNISLPSKGWPSVVLNVKANEEIERCGIVAPFSMFVNLKGESQIRVEGKNQHISSDTYGLVNKRQQYDLVIPDPGTTTFNIHFGEALFSETIYTLCNREDHLLDYPEVEAQEENILPRTEWKDPSIRQVLTKLQSHYEKVDHAINLEDDEEYQILADLLEILLGNNSRVRKSASKFDVQKRSTRNELVRRLYLSKEFIHTNYHRDITLHDLSKASCLSRYHFLRSFRKLFDCTPNQYLVNIRMMKAQELLKNSTLSLTEISRKTGYKETNSLIRAFGQKVGTSPMAFRKKAILPLTN